MVTLTYPHIGNTGTNEEDVESASTSVRGLIIRDLPKMPNNWRNTMRLEDYLEKNNIVAISDIDTRRLTRILREKGALSGCLMAGDDIDADKALATILFTLFHINVKGSCTTGEQRTRCYSSPPRKVCVSCTRFVSRRTSPDTEYIVRPSYIFCKEAGWSNTWKA